MQLAELTTPRLILRRWREEDEAPMTKINADPEVMRFLNNKPGLPTWYERVTRHWEEHGFGFFAVEGREGDLLGEFIGFVGIAYPMFLPELAARPELGWRLAPVLGDGDSPPRRPRRSAHERSRILIWWS